MVYKLPILYKVAATGKISIWKVSVRDDTMTTKWGYQGSIFQIQTRSFQGVNIGKKNETSAQEQARLMADRKWVSQLDKGYEPAPDDDVGMKLYHKVKHQQRKQNGTKHNISHIIQNNDDGVEDDDDVTNNETIIKPMLCNPWTFEPKCIKYFDKQPFYVQPKLDGVRMLASRNDKGEIVMRTRTGKTFKFLNHIRQALDKYLPKGWILDGEFYAHVLYGKLEGKEYVPSDDELPPDCRFAVISGAARPTRTDPHALETQLQYHVFDMIDIHRLDLPQSERIKKLDQWHPNTSVIVKVPYHELTYIDNPAVDKSEWKRVCETSIKVLHDEYALESYEGIILRAGDLIYQSDKRALGLRKYKCFTDEEFEIVGTNVKHGVSKEHFTWICKTTHGLEFEAKPIGTREMKLNWYANRKSYKGKLLTVQFQEKSKDGIPRFPIGKTIRDYE